MDIRYDRARISATYRDVMQNASKLLINEPPLQVLPSLAALIGLNEALTLQQVHYWLVNARLGENQAKFKEGRYWVYNSYPEWKRLNFPFWSTATIKRTFQSLEKSDLVFSDQLGGNDRRKWYTINYNHVLELELNFDSDTFPSGQNDLVHQVKVTPSTGSKRAVPSGQNEPMLNRYLTENTTETNQDRYLKHPSGQNDLMENTQAQKTWNRIRDQIKMNIPQSTYDTWIRHVIGIDQSVQEDKSVLLVLATRNESDRAWLESRITSTAQRLAIGILNKPNVEIKFIVKDPTP